MRNDEPPFALEAIALRSGPGDLVSENRRRRGVGYRTSGIAAYSQLGPIVDLGLVPEGITLVPRLPECRELDPVVNIIELLERTAGFRSRKL